jgi:hypothetical protein
MLLTSWVCLRQAKMKLKDPSLPKYWGIICAISCFFVQLGAIIDGEDDLLLFFAINVVGHLIGYVLYAFVWNKDKY